MSCLKLKSVVLSLKILISLVLSRKNIVKYVRGCSITKTHHKSLGAFTNMHDFLNRHTKLAIHMNICGFKLQGKLSLAVREN